MIADQQSKNNGEKPFRLIHSLNPGLVELSISADISFRRGLLFPTSETSENRSPVTFSLAEIWSSAKLGFTEVMSLSLHRLSNLSTEQLPSLIAKNSNFFEVRHEIR